MQLEIFLKGDEGTGTIDNLLSLVTLILFPLRILLMVYVRCNAKKMVWLSENGKV